MSQTRRLAAILAVDVAGYSRLMGADEEGTHERLKAHLRELVNPKIAEHRGRIVKNTGDGFLAEFASIVDAVRCAVEVQRRMVERNESTPPEKRIELRIGINLGDVIVEGQDIFGDGVNVAARLEALAKPGGICISRMVRDNVRDKLDYTFEDLGEQQVKKHRATGSGVCTASGRLNRRDGKFAVNRFTSATRRGAADIDRCVAVHQFEQRSGAAIFRRWNNRGPDDRSVADCGCASDFSQYRVHV